VRNGGGAIELPLARANRKQIDLGSDAQ